MKTGVLLALILAGISPALAQNGDTGANTSATKPAATASGRTSPSGSGGGGHTTGMRHTHHRHHGM